MTQEEKDLLLKDLCVRIPYGVKVQSYSYGEDDVKTIETLYEIDSDGYMSTLECETLRPISKPYLFPLSSMTEEQKKEINKRYVNSIDDYSISIRYHSEGYWDDDTEAGFSDYLWLIDWFIKNHFDYRGLIPMGLANDATGLNIY